MGYEDYRELVFHCASKGSCSGELSKEHINTTALNAQRIRAVEANGHLRPELLHAIQTIQEPVNCFLICETWCNDDAQIVPYIGKIASLCPNMRLYILLRDQNPLLMDQFLTRGKRAIPKFICQHRNTKVICGVWGPRPTRIADLVAEYRLLNKENNPEAFQFQLQQWYSRDKGNSLQEDLIAIIETCSQYHTTETKL